MNERFFLIAVLLPIVCGMAVPLAAKKGQRAMYLYVEAVTAATSCLVWALILFGGDHSFTLVQLTRDLSLTLRFDRLGRGFLHCGQHDQGADPDPAL